MIRVVHLILCLCCLTSCSYLHLKNNSYDVTLQPIHLKSAHSFADKTIITSLGRQLRNANIMTSDNSAGAKTIVTIRDTQHKAAKVANSSVTSDTVYYNNEYSTTLTIEYPTNKNKKFNHKISANEQMTILENQNTFNNYYNSEELEHELIARVMIAILATGQGPK